MSNNTVRIRTTPNGSDKYLKVKVEQDFDFIEILSLKITQEEAYTNYCSDYGVVAGRVIINSGFGVPNARVSIFIPLDDVDKNNPQIKGLYPYEIVTDKDDNGIRYNTLPRSSETDNECFTEIGTFPNKREILDNVDMLEVYCKYYKFTTTTNYAGDFMIFGVPLGTYTIHVDADISDIGIASQRPYDSITQGTPEKFFESPTKYKGGTNLDKLIQVKSANAGVNVQPFWGDTDTCEIGITRIDLDLNYDIKPSAIFMGSMFGDQDKDSVSKNCRPRRSVGALCTQVANEGTIEMIREKLDGSIERFDIEGGRVMDESGAWAYQIPMNLDYMVTSENGTLQPSDDPNKGLATRANVRFRIGMDQTGGEGRLRTRAKYLVPHNPNIKGEIDYEFGNKTKKSSFRSLYWNKIYSVSNFISRYQTTSALGGGIHTRSITGVKNVDDCGGDKTPFPYNKVNTSFTALFFIICLIIKIVAFLIAVMNAIIIPLINIVLSIINILLKAWNKVMRALCRASRRRILRVRIFGFLGFACRLIIDLLKYIPCITVKCPNDGENNIYAPGCSKGGLDSGKAYDATNPDYPTYYNGDNFGHSGIFSLVGLDDCIAFEMAKSMNLFQFDFYNDWVNGSLYGFLLKYKKKRKKIEKFCEYDCGPDFGIIQGGVDGNNDGNSDNACRANSLVDVCYNGGGKDSQFNSRKSSLREGLIKKIGSEFYYAASNHDGSKKIFATEIINLGAVFSCDWQGVPKTQPFLIPTTYKMAPDIQEVADDQATVLTTGLCGIGGSTIGIFFDIDCLGLHVDNRQCLNIRHQCEFGVELDENRAPLGPSANGIIGLADLDIDDGDRPKWFRDVFYGLNISANTWTLNYPYTTNFNLGDCGVYDFAGGGTTPSPCKPTVFTNGQDYVDFRGYAANGATAFSQPKHSYFFYFGILPGKTGLDKLNQKFFTTCIPKSVVEFNVSISIIPITSSNLTATVTVTITAGVGPFNYIISGPDGFTDSGQIITSNGISQGIITGLPVGTFTIEITSSDGTFVMQTIQILPPGPLFANAYVSENCTSLLSSNGEITISSAGGGNGAGTYEYQLFNSQGIVVSPTGTPPITNLTTPQIITGLPIDIGISVFDPNTNGYTLTVTDTLGAQVSVTNLLVTGPTALTVVSTTTNLTCFGADNGGILLTINGGLPPYSASTIGANNFYEEGTNITGLSAATYISSVVDANNGVPISVVSTVLSLNPYMVILKPTDTEVQDANPSIAAGGDPNNYRLPFYITYGGYSPTTRVEYNIDDAEDATGELIWLSQTLTFVNSTLPLILLVPAESVSENITIRISNPMGTCFSNEITYEKTDIILPQGDLRINVNGVDNSKQCVANQVTFSFNINDLQNYSTDDTTHYRGGYNGADGYRSTIWVTGWNQAGTVSVTTTTPTVVKFTLLENLKPVTLTVPQVGGAPAYSCSVYIEITYRKPYNIIDGYVYFSYPNPAQLPPPNPTLPVVYPNLTIPNIVLPVTTLTGQWGNIPAPAPSTNVIKRLSVFGGVQPYSSTPYNVYDGTVLTQYEVPSTQVITTVVTDSTGCKIIV
jgi:hypothetical protein